MQDLTIEQILDTYHIPVRSLSTIHYTDQPQIHVLEVPTSSAISNWQTLSLTSIPYWPILGNWQRHSSKSIASLPSTIIEKALHFDLDSWFAEDLLGSSPPLSWQNDYPLNVELPLTFTIVQKYSQYIPLTLVPTKYCWQVPAYLHYDIPDGPPAVVHTALWKQWEVQYGAKVVSIDHSTVEFSVDSPPTTAKQSQELAQVQSLYCPDIIDQWAWGIKNLAKILLNSKIWHFWWD